MPHVELLNIQTIFDGLRCHLHDNNYKSAILEMQTGGLRQCL